MTDDAAYDYTEEWPDDAPLKVFRLNPFFRRIIAGLARTYADTYYFNGTDQQKQEMVERMLVCAQQIELDYECPGGESEMTHVVQAALTIPENTQTGAQLSFYAYNQIPFDVLVGDTTGLASLDENGGLIVPAGNWLADLRVRLLFNAGVYVPIKLTHAEDDVIFTDIYALYGVEMSVLHAAVSDGETPIAFYVNPTSAYAYWGYSTVYNIERVVGTFTLSEMPA